MPRPTSVLSFSLLLTLVATSIQAKGPVYTDPEKADADFAIQGEYLGQVPSHDSDEKVALGVQIIALGNGTFRAVGFPGGLPGDGWSGEGKREAEGAMQDGKAVFTVEDVTVTVDGGVITITGSDGTTIGQLKRVNRKSPTQGKQPPAGAVVLFDGKTTDQLQGARVTADHLLQQGVTSKPTFGSHQLHLEFCLPYQPEDRGQARGNSGVYLQGRYEVQMLDSFGLEGAQNECGGIYTVKAPDVNMCFPPLSWQTYDIEFRAAKYDDDGQLVASPHMTVYHNGVLIHKDVQLPAERSTTAAPNKPGHSPGPVFLQDHGCPVRYRNIWVVPVE